MASMGAGEITGYGALALAGVAAFGKAIKWIWEAATGAQASRAAKLQIWHDELKAREDKHAALVEADMQELRDEVRGLRTEMDGYRRAFGIVAAELYRRDPGNSALWEAKDILQRDFPIHLQETPAAH